MKAIWTIPRNGLYGFMWIALIETFKEGTSALWFPVFLNLLLLSGVAAFVHWLDDAVNESPT